MKLPSRPLTDVDLQIYAKKLKIPHFRGVFMRDALPTTSQKRECGIINLDESDGRGTHWVAYFKHDKIVNYFDSFGNLKPPPEVAKYFKNCIILYNHDRFQDFNTYTCGHLCMKYLYNRTLK